MAWSFVLVLALGFLAFTYLGYPTCVMGLARLRRRRERAEVEAQPFPSLSCIVATHDEGEKLVEKVRALLALDYPPDKLEVVVADDASSDGSPERARALDPSRVRVAPAPRRGGKPSALVRAARIARGEILLMCDVRQRLHPGAAAALVRPFADPEVGAATGRLRMEAHKGAGFYWRYEEAIRRAEGRIGGVVGVTGALYAIRRACFPLDLPAETLIDDVYIPMRVAFDGYRVVWVNEAEAYDVEFEMKHEFRRKVRTLAGNYQLLRLLPGALSPRRNPLFLQFCGHKLARLLCPWALIAALVSAALGVGIWVKALLILQLCAYALAGLGWARGHAVGKVPSLCFTFLALNVAVLVALSRFIQGKAQVTWAPGAKERAVH